MTDLLSMSARDFQFSADPSRPDYACPAYRQMAPSWQIVKDIRDGTPVLREQRAVYLPKFEAETVKDWAARVAMTFCKDHYAATIEEHVGLVFATPPKLGDDVPQQLKDLAEDIDGEGNHLEVFAETAFDSALHYGHCVLYTDYPDASHFTDLTAQRQAKARPYVTLYSAPDVLSWEEVAVGGVKIICKIKFRETNSESVGDFGVADSVTYREIRQEVFYDEVSGRAKGLGAITWRSWKETKSDGPAPGSSDATGVASAGLQFTPIGQGVINGPPHIPARVVYGGRKLGTLKTVPHLLGLAYSNVEETQIESDYANVMHKCNVPTPVFIGRNTDPATGGTVQMGQGLDIPIGGDAKMLEPSGNSIAGTRTRLEDLRAHMRRQGASSDMGSKVMTAKEAGIYAKQRDAKLKRGARSLQDALEGMLADMASFLRIGKEGVVKSGGSVVVQQDFAGQSIDPAYLSVLVQAYTATPPAITLDALMYALKEGRLPDDFDAEDAALRLIAEELSRKEAADAEAKRVADQAAADAAAAGDAPPADKQPPLATAA